MEEQIRAWKKAARKMSWPIAGEIWAEIGQPPPLDEHDRHLGFSGVAIFYGFGDDGRGNADPLLSGQLAWEYGVKTFGRKTWQSPHMKFGEADMLRMRPGAPHRKRGFYFGKVDLGECHRRTTVAEMRRRFNGSTGFGPEGFQLLCVTHPHIPGLMSGRRLPFMALADYEVAPHGFNDFYDVPQLFSSNGILGLGIGNVDYDYPGFGIPQLIICRSAKESAD
jgi:hypothetical protein